MVLPQVLLHQESPPRNIAPGSPPCQINHASAATLSATMHDHWGAAFRRYDEAEATVVVPLAERTFEAHA
jgi:hypothetical protein